MDAELSRSHQKNHQLVTSCSDEAYLAHSEIIDWQQPEVLALARTLAKGAADQQQIAKRCFEYVRDNIKHSVDYQLDTITLKASQVLQHGTGYCYAKSHLLAALLRANQIPAGLCYQRLTITDQPPFCLHGLNAVLLEDYGWYRIDARGNKPGVNAQFCPPTEQLAFNLVHEGEADFPQIWAEPLPQVAKALTDKHGYLQVLNNLPDIGLEC